ncbi:MAG TPA: hypothetical protein VKB73_09890 [Gaiellaceae bacterium]|nr:hypothetical protein [Gaiellaceae bacterium]
MLVTVTSTIDLSNSSIEGVMSFAISGVDAVPPSDANALILTPSSGQANAASASFIVGGLTPGAVDTFTAMYKAPGAANQTAFFSDRSIWAVPLP